MEDQDMVARKTRRSAAHSHIARLPDDRAVVGCAVTALVALLLMLLAGTAKAEEPDLVCWDLLDGKLECESRASIAATCEAIDDKHELCAAVQSNSATRPYLPGNTKYTTIKMTRAGREIWNRSKPHMNVMP
jgi:hypothetical protein